MGRENLPRARYAGNYDPVVSPDFTENPRSLAEIIVRFGLYLRPGLRLLIAEPYELQGVRRHAALGDAYPFTHRRGMALSADQLDSAGFNRSLIHVDVPLDTRDMVWSA